MKVIGRMREEGETRDRRANGDLLVTMTETEFETWRTLTGPRTDGNLVLDAKVVEAFERFRYATSEAAIALGIVPEAK